MPGCDVLVVGAGPAGSLAALILARAGVSVALLDRARFPRDKLCGDTLNPGSLAILERHALADGVRERALPITGMTVTGPGGASVSADYPRGLRGAALRRSQLDVLLVEAAVGAGARFESAVNVIEPVVAADRRMSGVRVTHRASGEVWNARVIVGADGRGSRLGAALGLTGFAAAPKRWAFGAYFEGVEGLTARGEMHIRGDGYIGVAPLPRGLANVCVVRARRDAERLEPHTVVRDALAADAVLRDRFRGARQASLVAVLGPLAVDARGAGMRGLLLAGDAAGFVDPMTGDGLRFALRGAELAAEAALEELSTGIAAHGRLARARAAEFSGKWRINRALRALVGSPRALTVAAQVAGRWHAPVEYLIGVAGDVETASSKSQIPNPKSQVPNPKAQE